MNANSHDTTPDQKAKHAPRRIGLHGHSLDRNMALGSTAEAIGTFFLVLAIAGTAVAATLSRPVAGPAYDSLAVPIAGGLALTLLVAGLGQVSGGHFNPAVTIGLATNRRFPWAYVPAYLIAQLGGAITAALLIWALYGHQARSKAALGASLPASGVSVWRVFVSEAVITFLLVLVVIAVAMDDRVSRTASAIAIGAALAVAILIGGPISGAGVNPARAIGPMIVAGRFTDWWAYLVAPLAAGIVAVVTYDKFLSKARVG